VLANILMAATASPPNSSVDEPLTGFDRERRRWTVTELVILTEECSEPPHTAERCHRKRREYGSKPLTGSEDIAMIPPEVLVEMTRPLRSSSLFDQLATPIPNLALHDEVLTDEDAAGVVGFTEETSIGKQFDVRVCEVIQKEVMDWCEPNQLNHRRGCRTVGSGLLSISQCTLFLTICSNCYWPL